MVGGLLSNCSKVLFSSREGGDSSLVAISRGAFASCDVQEATLYLWRWGAPLWLWYGASLLVAEECYSRIVVG